MRNPWGSLLLFDIPPSVEMQIVKVVTIYKSILLLKVCKIQLQIKVLLLLIQKNKQLILIIKAMAMAMAFIVSLVFNLKIGDLKLC